jgi:hypothetical protein
MKTFKTNSLKKYLTATLLLAFFLVTAQNGKKLERIKALRVAYISNKLDLTSNEAEKFWPIFNDFDAKQFNLRLQKRILNLQLSSQNNNDFSEKEMNKLLEDSEKIEDETQLNRKNFVKKLKGIIAPQKIILLKQLEDEFKRELLSKIGQNKRIRD